MGFLRIIGFFIVLFVLLSACKKDDSNDTGQVKTTLVTYSQNTLFPKTTKIPVLYYEYILDGNLIISSGDSSNVRYPDTFPSTPSFSWCATGNQLVVVAIFNSWIEVSLTKILNGEDIVWMWHTGLYTGREGTVRYGDGYSLSNGIALYDTLYPLQNNMNYYWAVWAWGNDGKKVEKSSQAFPFYVK